MPTAVAEATIDLISPSANYWLSLETNVDDYNGLGGMRLAKPGRKIRFSRGRASCPAAWREDLERHPGYRRNFWFADDVTNPGLARFGPEVVSGQRRASMPEADQPPLPDWNTLGAREIREAINAGRVNDPIAALAWEGAHKARAQVLEALGKAIRAGAGEDPGDEPEPAAEAEASEGFVRPTPDSAGGF